MKFWGWSICEGVNVARFDNLDIARSFKLDAGLFLFFLDGQLKIKEFRLCKQCKKSCPVFDLNRTEVYKSRRSQIE
jgi:hypothetical protein